MMLGFDSRAVAASGGSGRGRGREGTSGGGRGSRGAGDLDGGVLDRG